MFYSVPLFHCYLPACSTEALACTADSDGTLPHAWKTCWNPNTDDGKQELLKHFHWPHNHRIMPTVNWKIRLMQSTKMNTSMQGLLRTYFNMLRPIIRKPLIHLVTEANNIMLYTQVSYHLQLFSPKDLQNKEWYYLSAYFVSLINLLLWVQYQWNIKTFLRNNLKLLNSGCKWAELTLPNGLLGLLMIIAFVQELNLLASSSGHNTQSALDKAGPVTFFWKIWTNTILSSNILWWINKFHSLERELSQALGGRRQVFLLPLTSWIHSSQRKAPQWSPRPQNRRGEGRKKKNVSLSCSMLLKCLIWLCLRFNCKHQWRLESVQVAKCSAQTRIHTV